MGEQELDYPVKIGLEIHGYLDTVEKLFCMCRTSADCEGNDLPNTRICPICTGTPGSKPMGANEMAVLKMVQIAHVLGSKVQTGNLTWHRKHYDWADNPKGYQTTISGSGVIPCSVGGKFKGIRITEAHLEEDPAQWNPDSGYINYNRSGLPLIEIVTEPDFKNSDDVISWLKDLLLSLSYIRAVRKNAGIKVDVNVSTYGERVEMKNINSLEKIKKAIDYEISRQVENYKKGIEQKRDTLAFDEKLGKTIKMRSKEGAADYRFIPEPDLAVLKVSEEMIKEAKENMPEMPEVKLKKLLNEYKVDKKNASILSRNLDLVEFFEGLVNSGVEVSTGISWVTIELLRVLNYNKKSLEDIDIDIKPAHLAELILAVQNGQITTLKGKQIMNDFIPKSFSLKDHKDEISNIDSTAIENIASKVIDENQHVVNEYKSGNEKSLNFLIGQVMRKSDRRADFKSATEILKKILSEDSVDN